MQEQAREQHRECRIRRRQRADDGHRAGRDRLEVENPGQAVEQVGEDAGPEKLVPVRGEQRRMGVRKEEAEIDQRGGEHVIQAEARRRHLADPALHQALAETIEQERRQRRGQPGEQRGGRGGWVHGIRSGRGALATPAAPGRSLRDGHARHQPAIRQPWSPVVSDSTMRLASVFILEGRGGSVVTRTLAVALLMAALAGNALAADRPRDAGQVVPELTAIQPEIEALYRDLHQHPELGFHEVRTADTLASRLKALGYEVTTGVGKTGIVAMLRNGPGPVVMRRPELDALPDEEKTGMASASKEPTRNDAGEVVPVAHACGHDLHMAGWIGTAQVMAARRAGWHGTLMLVGQPAEETAGGAATMLADGLFSRFPKPDFAIGVHDENTLPCGQVGDHAGPFRASAEVLEVTIYGRGGHGAYPHTAVDPIVIAARAILGFQTIVSRETNPLSPAVVTVGAIHAGTAGNIIPEQLRMLMWS